MFDGQCCQMGIGHQVGRGFGTQQHLLKDCPVLFRRADDFGAGLVYPTLDTGYSLLKEKGAFEDSRIGADPNKCGKHCPAQTDGIAAGKLFIPPLSGLNMVSIQGILGIKKDIGINQDQRYPSPSMSAKSSPILSKLRPARNPMAIGSVR